MVLDKKHIDSDRDEWIDSYIRNELSEAASTQFEEHLLDCSKCKKELLERKEIVSLLQSFSAADILQTTMKYRRKRLKRIVAYAIAALALAILIAIFLSQKV